MKYTDFATYVRFQTNTDSTTFDDATMAIYYNIAKNEIARSIAEVDEGFFGMVMTRDLVENQRNYSFDETQLNHMKYLEANINPPDPGTTEDWQRLECYDIHQLGLKTDEDNIISFMSGRKNGYIIFGGEVILLTADPIIDVTAGLKLWTTIYPQDIEDSDLASPDDISLPFSSIEFGMPIGMHELLARRVIMSYKESFDRPIAPNEREQAYKYDLMQAINQLKGLNHDQTFIAQKPFNDGSNY